MEYNLALEMKKRLLKNKKKRLRWMTVLASVVVFCTTYALILPAITLEGKTWCGHEAHEHGEKCYEKILICDISEEGHQHTEACVKTEKILVCDISEEGHQHVAECRKYEEVLTCEVEEKNGHSHSESCYSQEAVLECTLTEDESHTHAEDCYSMKKELNCGQEEQEGHTHTSACYTKQESFICGQEEAQRHEHTDACYQEETTYICGQEETEAHTHVEGCYEKTLSCTEEEHEHELICYSNPEADLETSEIWERTLPDELSGVWADDIVLVAESQLGYKESIDNYIVTEDGSKKGYTRYGAWYKDAYGDWCAMFVSFCLNYAEIPEEVVAREANCVKWIEKLEKQELYFEAEDFVPEKGDIIFFDMRDTVDGTDHMGIVVEVDEKQQTVKAIEGNSDNKVQHCTYEIDDASILGYGELPLNPEQENSLEEEIPIDEIQMEEVPAEEVPAEEVPTEEVPVEEVPVEEVPTEDSLDKKGLFMMNQAQDDASAEGVEGRASTIAEGKYGNYYFGYNDVKNAFTTEAEYAKYYNSDSPLGVAGSFHIVAFDTATLSTHTNGNVLAHTLRADSNFGTNNYSDELTYAMYYQKLNSTSASANGHILVIGSDNTVTIGGNNDNVYVNGVKIDKPNNIIQDANTTTAPFIDLNAVNVEIAGISSRLSRSADGGVTTSFEDQNNRSITLNNPSGVGYYTIKASELNNYANNPLRMKGFTKNGDGTIIINVDCTGVKTINVPVATVWIDGQEQSTAEVTEFSNGKVVWNFVNAAGATINTNRMTGMIIALGATVNIKQNLNGTVIAEDVNVQAESHRTDFTGQIEVLSDDGDDKASIGIRKVDNANISIYLQGAKFTLYKWNGRAYEVVAENLETNANGLLSIKELTYNTAYRLIETSAPKGYILEDTPYDFYVPNSNTSQYPYNRPSNYKGSAHNALVIKNIKNTKDTEEKLDITIQKEWYIEEQKVTSIDGMVKIDVYQQVYKDAECTQKAMDDILYVAALEIDSHQGWEVTLDNLPAKGSKTIQGVQQTVYYKYYVEEEPIRGYEASYENNDGITDGTIIIKNTSDGEKVYTELTLEKKWFDFQGNVMEAPLNAEVTIQLYQTGYEGPLFHHPLTEKILYREITLNAENGWKQTITDLPEHEVINTVEGKQTVYYMYTAEEVALNGYEDTYENNNVYEGTITIKNTIDDNPTEITVLKKWLDQNGEEITKEGEIKITLYQKVHNGSTYIGQNRYKENIVISSTEGWEKTIDNLPLYGWTLIDGESAEISYTYYVQEEQLTDYKTTYENNEGITGEETDNTIIITNKELATYNLPETGGIGRNTLAIIGLAFMMLSLLGYGMIFVRKGDKD